MRDEERYQPEHNRNYIRSEINFTRHLYQFINTAGFLLVMGFVYFVFMSLVHSIDEAFPNLKPTNSVLCGEELEKSVTENDELVPKTELPLKKDEPIRLEDGR